MIEVAGEFATIALISAIAFVSPIIAERVKIPAVVLEIVLGMVFGVSFLNIIQESEWLSFLSLFGLIFLMFLAGLEIEVENVLRSGNLKQIVAFFSLSLSLAVVFAVLMGFDLFYAIILTNVAVGVVVSVLREVGLEKENFGQINIVTALVSDFSTMFLLSIYFLTGLLQIAFALMIILVFYVAYRFGKLAIWYFPDFISRWFSDEPSEIGVRGSLAIMILFVGLSSLLGVEAILGAFLAGVLLSITFRGGRKLYDKLYGMGFGFFIPIFFIKTGSELNIFQGIERLDLVIILLLASMLVKIVPSLIFSPVFGVRKAISMGALQSTKLSLTVAGVAIAMTAGIITEIEATALVTFTIVSCLLSPTLFQYLYPSFLPNTR
ncbi:MULTISPECIES: cation:proton antiporter [unclassified Archaeoglobus]|uniref:cation:proton antiporter domain-containing protein n=1 Tax=unclassified Archaeoglobus TaxID=2643606 RepID=UPI0025C4C16E|nr:MULTISPECIES: cation:proton antiporter [unclassified Archaeoglobus]